MNSFYIGTKIGDSGICKYTNDFFELVLKQKNYTFLDSSGDFNHIVSLLSFNDNIHLEIGLFQKKEIKILLHLLKLNYKNITITLHDPPLFKFPFYEFKNHFLNKVSKFFDLYLNSFNAINPYLNNLKYVYVLSQKGVNIVKNKYNLKNVYYLPHIIDIDKIEYSKTTNNNFIYLGFIGKNKGIEYSLQLHQNILQTHPNVKFYVVGKAMGNEVSYFNKLKTKYHKNIEYLGYLSENELDRVFDNATFAPLFFNSYKFYYPFSGSILFALKKGKIVLSNSTNTTLELIENGKNGFIFTGNLAVDTQNLLQIFEDATKLENIKKEIPVFLNNKFSATEVNQYFKN